MAATVSDLHATRSPTMRRTMVGNRDPDGNILDQERSEVQTYCYQTGSIPSFRYENLLRLIAVDYDQCILVYHQLVQGMG